MIKSGNNDISNITYGNNKKIEKVYLGDSLIWPYKHLTPEFEAVDGIENASGNFEDVYDTSLNAWFKKAKQYDPSQDKIVTTSKYILYGDGTGGKEEGGLLGYTYSYFGDYKTLVKTAYFHIESDDFVKITDDDSYIELKTSNGGSHGSYLQLNSLRDFFPLYNQEISFKVDSLDDNYEFTLGVLGKIKIISNPFDPSTNGTFVSGKITIKPTTTYQTLVFQDWSIDERDSYDRRIFISWGTPENPEDTPQMKKGYIKINQNLFYPYYFEGLPVFNRYFEGFPGEGQSAKIIANMYVFENNELEEIIEPEVQLTEDFPHNIPITKNIKTEWLEEGKDWQTDGGKAKDGFVYHTSNPYPEYDGNTYPQPAQCIIFNKTDEYGNKLKNYIIQWQACSTYPGGYDSSRPKGTSYTYTASKDSGPYLYFGGVTDASTAQRLHFMSVYLYDMRRILPKKDNPLHNYVKYSSVDELELNEVPYVGMYAYIGSGVQYGSWGPWSDYEKYQFVYENNEYTWKDTGEKLSPYVKYNSVDELEHVKPYVGMYAYVGSDNEKYQFVYENFEYKWKDTGEKLGPYVKRSSMYEVIRYVAPYVGLVAYIEAGPDYQKYQGAGYYKYQFVYENNEYTWKYTKEIWTYTGETWEYKEYWPM